MEEQLRGGSSCMPFKHAKSSNGIYIRLQRPFGSLKCPKPSGTPAVNKSPPEARGSATRCYLPHNPGGHGNILNHWFDQLMGLQRRDTFTSNPPLRFCQLHHHNPLQLLWVDSFHCIGVNCHVSSLEPSGAKSWQKKRRLLWWVHQIVSFQTKFSSETRPWKATMLALGVKNKECQGLTNNWGFNDISIITNDQCRNFAITRSSYILQQPCRTCWFRLPQRPVGTKGHSTSFQSHRTTQQHCN